MTARFVRALSLSTIALLTNFSAATASGAGPDAGPAAIKTCCCPASDGLAGRQSENFRVQAASDELAQSVAEACERLRSELFNTWLNTPTPVAWTSRCEVVVHGSLTTYRRAAGSGAELTAGFSRFRVAGGRVVGRRIDLRSDGGRDPLTAALPHELVHLVLADHFAGGGLPRWADEGLAVLADTATKQAGHERDYCQSLARGESFRLIELLRLDRYPDENRCLAFYGQSQALVRMLVQRKSPAAFVDFIEQSQAHGYDAALSDVYGIANVAALEQQFLHAPPGNDVLVAAAASSTKVASSAP